MSQKVHGLAVLAVFGLGLAYVMARTIRNADDRRHMSFNWLVTVGLSALIYYAVPLFGVFGLFLIVLSAVILSLIWTPHIGEIVAKPLTSLFDGGGVPLDPRPLYSIAQAKQKKGHYLEAIADIRRQLEKFPTDLEGQLLIAQIQAENLNDLEGAEATIQALCSQSGHAPANIAFALYSLADWRLKYGRDREGARRAFEQVVQMLPGTEYALTAAQRIAHLANPDMPLDPHDHKFVVPEGIRNLGLLMDMDSPRTPEKTAGQKAADLVKHLEKHPLDTEAREQLAVIYADHYHRLDLAGDQLEQMIQLQGQPMKNVTHWLNLLANLQIRSGAGYEAVRKTLQRIIDLAPNLAAAETARNRIALLRLEMRALETSKPIALGTYEQNVGLKQGQSGGVGGGYDKD